MVRTSRRFRKNTQVLIFGRTVYIVIAKEATQLIVRIPRPFIKKYTSSDIRQDSIYHDSKHLEQENNCRTQEITNETLWLTAERDQHSMLLLRKY
jgi:thiamine kinase-like enzyme